MIINLCIVGKIIYVNEYMQKNEVFRNDLYKWIYAKKWSIVVKRSIWMITQKNEVLLEKDLD